MERHNLTMRFIIKAVDRPVGATEHFISAVAYCKYCAFERISAYYISFLPVNKMWRNMWRSSQKRPIYTIVIPF